jgi:hypothetical protein
VGVPGSLSVSGGEAAWGGLPEASDTFSPVSSDVSTKCSRARGAVSCASVAECGAPVSGPVTGGGLGLAASGLEAALCGRGFDARCREVAVCGGGLSGLAGDP